MYSNEFFPSSIKRSITGRLMPMMLWIILIVYLLLLLLLLLMMIIVILAAQAMIIVIIVIRIHLYGDQIVGKICTSLPRPLAKNR